MLDKSVPFSKRDVWTQKHRQTGPCEIRGRYWNDAAASQGMKRTAGNHQKLWER